MAKKKSFIKKVLISIVGVLLVFTAVSGYLAYHAIYQPNVSLGGKKSEIIYIKTGSSFSDVVNMLYEHNLILNRTTFEWVAKRKKYDQLVKAGRYRILAKMGNNDLLNLLRSGEQEPVQVTFNNIRTKEQLISRVCNRIEADSAVLIELLNDEQMTAKYGFDKQTIMSIFIPNTYEFFWNTSAEQFVERMAKEYKKFWTDERKAKAKATGLTQSEVVVLASIVQAEQNRYNDEKPIIAGLYINRLKKNMLLQSDPTVIFAIGDFSINRVLTEDMLIDSPYNTYKYAGLPPSPINIPEISSVDAVINYAKSNYIYMCAKEDLSGRHNFASTLVQHNRNANKYRAALNKRKIMR